MSTLRNITDEMIYVGYYLSRLSDAVSGGPPVGLGVSEWDDVYDMFATALSNGRTEKQFRHTMENIRNAFDGFHANPRPGWRSEGTDTEISQQRAACVVSHHNWDEDRLDMRAFQIAAGQGTWQASKSHDNAGARVT